jgi:hypothetical protein
MSSKPFIAARIPEELNQALNAHSEATRESRTQALMNALSQYLGVADIAADRPQASADSSSLLSRVIRLEEIVEQMQGANIVIEIDNNTDNDLASDNHANNKIVISTDNANPPKTEEERSQPALFVMTSDNPDNNNDNTGVEGAVSTKDLAEMTGMKVSTVKTRSNKGTTVEHNGIVYKPVSKGTRGYWWIPQ